MLHLGIDLKQEERGKGRERNVTEKKEEIVRGERAKEYKKERRTSFIKNIFI